MEAKVHLHPRIHPPVPVTVENVVISGKAPTTTEDAIELSRGALNLESDAIVIVTAREEEMTVSIKL